MIIDRNYPLVVLVNTTKRTISYQRIIVLVTEGFASALDHYLRHQYFDLIA
jgi:hypothetical protein